MILKMKGEGGRWNFYDDIINFDYFKDSLDKRIDYNVMRRRGFDFSGSTKETLYLLNDDGKTIEKIN